MEYHKNLIICCAPSQKSSPYLFSRPGGCLKGYPHRTSQAGRRCSLWCGPPSTPLHLLKGLFSGLVGEPSLCFPVSQGVSGSFQKNRLPGEHPCPCGGGTQAQVLQNSETQKLSSSTSLSMAKSNSGLENIQSTCNQTDKPTVFPLNRMNKWRESCSG